LMLTIKEGHIKKVKVIYSKVKVNYQWSRSHCKEVKIHWYLFESSATCSPFKTKLSSIDDQKLSFKVIRWNWKSKNQQCLSIWWINMCLI